MGEPPDHHASQSMSEGKKGELVGASWTAMRATSRFANAAGEAPSQLVACQRSQVALGLSLYHAQALAQSSPWEAWSKQNIVSEPSI